MKLDLGPVRPSYVAPTFGGDEKRPIDPTLEQRMRKPMVVGAAIIGTLVIGLGLWASFTTLPIAVTAPGEVRIESNRKTLRHREGGTVRQIFVREGQRVRAGQPLITFNDVEARAAVDVYQNQYDALLAENARFVAEAMNRPALAFPPELTARSADPRVAALIRDQEFLFATRLQLFQSQSAVMQQRLEQIETQIQGQQAQVESVEVQKRLTEEELAGYKILNEKGYAPKTLILRYERTLADLNGRRGSLVADIARLRQQMGETRLQLASLRDQRESQAAEGLGQSQSRISDTLPRLTTARQTLEGTVVRSPVDGYVFNLTQFTIGGVTGAGEVLMDIVPSNSPLLVSVMIRPEDVDNVHVGLDATVRITGVNQRWQSPLPAKVVVVSADRITNKEAGTAFYRVDLRSIRRTSPTSRTSPCSRACPRPPRS
ncbi:HlyD family type I secretion periplasmic adaptor subunit [Phenylobacterium sp. J367]|uniref:HlyD family type I secretion periplasmic adaptor subunit n=1 Tax=Phenylobacterium sp. J367 TaxID=2898435 RepID=UPI002150886B|nr:HlyD family type I secretion periplasmic adaptor subunit [Phenylobacterium sp. J367]MCR5877535.1 HlyD family type I secretion periplasmic adaptor subunit [Phenylobacterium sp. J367]